MPHNAPQRILFYPCAISENIGARDGRELFRDIRHQNSITWRSRDHRGEAGNFQNHLRPKRNNTLPRVKSWQEWRWNGVIIMADLHWCGIHKQDPLCHLNAKLLFGKVSFIVVLFLWFVVSSLRWSHSRLCSCSACLSRAVFPRWTLSVAAARLKCELNYRYLISARLPATRPAVSSMDILSPPQN